MSGYLSPNEENKGPGAAETPAGGLLSSPPAAVPAAGNCSLTELFKQRYHGALLRVLLSCSDEERDVLTRVSLMITLEEARAYEAKLAKTSEVMRCVVGTSHPQMGHNRRSVSPW